MPRKKNKDDYLIRQAFTPEGRMQQLTKQAFDLAERQLQRWNYCTKHIECLTSLWYNWKRNPSWKNLKAKKKLNESKISLIDSEVKEKEIAKQ